MNFFRLFYYHFEISDLRSYCGYLAGNLQLFFEFVRHQISLSSVFVLNEQVTLSVNWYYFFYIGITVSVFPALQFFSEFIWGRSLE